MFKIYAWKVVVKYMHSNLELKSELSPLFLERHSYSLNTKINTLHKKCFRINYNDKKLTWLELLDKDKSVSINSRNAPTLTMEILDVTTGFIQYMFASILNSRNEMN